MQNNEARGEWKIRKTRVSYFTLQNWTLSLYADTHKTND